MTDALQKKFAVIHRDGSCFGFYDGMEEAGSWATYCGGVVVRPLMASGCHHCDFSSGQRGMDRCGVCDGTGSVIVMGGKSFPNTEEGYTQALRRKAARQATFSAQSTAADGEAATGSSASPDLLGRVGAGTSSSGSITDPNVAEAREAARALAKIVREFITKNAREICAFDPDSWWSIRLENAALRVEQAAGVEADRQRGTPTPSPT